MLVFDAPPGGALSGELSLTRLYAAACLESPKLLPSFGFASMPAARSKVHKLFAIWPH